MSEENINKLSKETGFTQREGGKISGFEILNLVINKTFGTEKLSLNSQCEQFEEQTGKNISKQSLNERFNERLILLITCVLEEVLFAQKDEELIVLLKSTGIKSLLIKDATSFQLPESLKESFKGSGGSASLSSIKIQFECDFLNGKVRVLSLHSGTYSDVRDAKETVDKLEEGDCILRDLGYFLILTLKKVDTIGAYYLSKLHHNIDIYEDKIERRKLITKNQEPIKEKIDLGRIETYMKQNKLATIEKDVYIGNKDKYKTRLIIELLPDAVKEKKIRELKKAAKSRKREVDKITLKRAGFNLYVTNLSSGQLGMDNAHNLYRLRWQIELMFKIWKSEGKIHHVQKMKKDRFVSCLYGKLVYFFINWKILWNLSYKLFYLENKLISFSKAFKGFRNTTRADYKILEYSVAGIQAFIDILESKAPNYYLLEKKKKKISSLEILLLFTTEIK